jgi:hypothetical protein
MPFSASLTVSKIIEQGMLTNSKPISLLSRFISLHICSFMNVSLYFCDELGICYSYNCNRFQTPSSNSSLSPSNQKLQKMFAQKPLCYFTLHKNITLTKAAHVSKIYYHLSFQNLTVRGTNVTPLTRLHVCHVVITKCMKFWSTACSVASNSIICNKVSWTLVNWFKNWNGESCTQSTVTSKAYFFSFLGRKVDWQKEVNAPELLHYAYISYPL